jgi:Casein kinase II regulatory subunit
MAFNEDSSGSGQDEPWIQWFVTRASDSKSPKPNVCGLCRLFRFCKLKGHEMFCEVERSYIEDGFNLYGLRACVSNFSDCLDLILDRFGPDDDSDDSQLTQSACTLYGLIHARYILTAHGLDAMYAKVRTERNDGMIHKANFRHVLLLSSTPLKNSAPVHWSDVEDSRCYP